MIVVASSPTTAQHAQAIELAVLSAVAQPEHLTLTRPNVHVSLIKKFKRYLTNTQQKKLVPISVWTALASPTTVYLAEEIE